MKKIKIRPFELGWEKAVCDIHNAAFDYYIRGFGELYGYHHITSSEVLTWLHPLNAPRLFPVAKKFEQGLWVAFIDDTPVGYVCCQLEQDSENSDLSLVYEETKEELGQSKIAVLPNYQRKGVASALLEQTMIHYHLRGARRAIILIYNDNKPASALMEKFNFERDDLYAVLAECDLGLPVHNVPKTENIVIRELQETDYGDLRRIFQSRPDVGLAPSIQQLKDWYSMVDPWAEVSLVAEINNKVVGCMEFTKNGLLGIPGVLPSYQNKGIGSMLFSQLLKSMQAKNKVKALSDTGSMLPEAIKMYNRFGFNITRQLNEWAKKLIIS